MATKHTYNIVKHSQPVHHFLITNVQQWQSGTDLCAMLKRFEKEKMTFWVWYIPLEASAPYEISFYQPQVEGSILLQTVEFRNNKRELL